MPQKDSAATGLLAAITAFLIWGLAPLYFKALDGIAPLEILAHRSIWSLVLALIIMIALGKLSGIWATLKNKKHMAILALSTVLVAANWLIFIWAIANDQLLDASLGYYINPLLNVLLGLIFLGERFRPLQWLAVAAASIGIAYELWQFGKLPVVALALALTFGFYGLVRKRAPIDSLTGLGVETLLMFPFAVGYLIWSTSPTSDLMNNSLSLNALLLFAGPLTLVPLLLFTIAARRLNLSTVGFLQYIGPTLMLLVATFIFHEPFNQAKLVTFGFVWLGLTLYSIDAVMQRRKQRLAAPATAGA